MARVVFPDPLLPMRPVAPPLAMASDTLWSNCLLGWDGDITLSFSTDKDNGCSVALFLGFFSVSAILWCCK